MSGVFCFQSFEESDCFVMKAESQMGFGFIIQGVDRMEMIGMIPPEAGKGLDRFTTHLLQAWHTGKQAP